MVYKLIVLRDASMLHDIGANTVSLISHSYLVATSDNTVQWVVSIIIDSMVSWSRKSIGFKTVTQIYPYRICLLAPRRSFPTS